MESETLTDCVLRTGAEMLADRGQAEVRPLDGDGVGWQSETCQFVFLDPDDPRKRVGIHDVRALVDEQPDRDLVLVARGGGTPFLLGRLAEAHPHGRRVEVFVAEELRRNVTKHSLVPRHRRLAPERTQALLEELGVSDKAMLPAILASDPIARYYAWQPGDTIEIERSELRDSGMVQADLAVRIVVTS